MVYTAASRQRCTQTQPGWFWRNAAHLVDNNHSIQVKRWGVSPPYGRAMSRGGSRSQHCLLSFHSASTLAVRALKQCVSNSSIFQALEYWTPISQGVLYTVLSTMFPLSCLELTHRLLRHPAPLPLACGLLGFVFSDWNMTIRSAVRARAGYVRAGTR